MKTLKISTSSDTEAGKCTIIRKSAWSGESGYLVFGGVRIAIKYVVEYSNSSEIAQYMHWLSIIKSSVDIKNAELTISNAIITSDVCRTPTIFTHLREWISTVVNTNWKWSNNAEPS